MKAQLIYLTGEILKILNVGAFLTNKYNDADLVTVELELIQDEIDIDSIKEMELDVIDDVTYYINDLIKAVKQLNKKLEEK